MCSLPVKQTDDADNGQFGQSARTYNRLFELLSCKRLADAIALAERAGMFRLATLLSQLDGDAAIPTMIRNQLTMWRVTEADLTIAPELVKLYRLLAGTVVAEDANGTTESSLLGLGWLRGIGILFWYCSSTDSFIESISTLSSSLENYRIVLQDSFVDAPVSPYLNDRDAQGADVSYPSTVHGLYAMLELLYPASPAASMDLGEAELEMDIRSNVIAALRPNGYTRDALDHRASYLLLVMLESAGISHINATHAHIIRQHYIFQLLSAGLWQWALFVALQIPDLSARYCIVSDIVLRFGGECNWDAEKRASERETFPSLYAFLTTALSVPEALLHEASAYRSGYEHDHNKQVINLISAGRFRLATEVTVSHLAPTAMLASGAAADQLLQLLETISGMAEAEASEQSYRSAYSDHWTDLSAVFLPFLRLKKHVALLGEAQSAGPVEEMRAALEVPNIVREARQLLERLTTLHQQRKTHVLRGTGDAANRTSGGLSLVSKEHKLIQVVLFDMGTYLYSLLQRLEMTDFSEGDEPATAGASMLHVQSLLTREHLDLAPVLNEKLANTASRCNSEFLQAAATRLVLAQN